MEVFFVKANLKRLISLFLVITILVLSCSLSITATATQSLSEVDSFLLKTGMSMEVIQSLDDDLKQTIYDTSEKNCDKEFVSIETKFLNQKNDSEIMPLYISPNDFKVTLVAFKENNYNGYTQYSIYPSFEWKTDVHIKDDAFGFSLPSGWEVVPGKKKLNLHYYNIYQERWLNIGAITSPYAASFTGYGFNGFGNFMQSPQLFKGTAYMYAYKKNPSVSNQIKIGYAHENSAGGVHLPGSISVSIGPLNVSFSGSGGVNMITYEDIFGF